MLVELIVTYCLYSFVNRPPRFMGEGFVVLQSGEVEYVYLQDVPGKLICL